MQARSNATALQLGDNVLVETCVDSVPLAFRGKLSSLLPELLWVKVPDTGCPPLVGELKEGHPVRLSSPRDGASLVGESTFQRCFDSTRRLVAVGRPQDLHLVDRRSQLRLTLRRSVGIRLARTSLAGEGGHFAVGCSCDISLAGMSLETTIHVAVGDHVLITMPLDRNRPFYGLGQVIRLEDAVSRGSAAVGPHERHWHQGRHVVKAAVKWEGMCPSDRARLQTFLVDAERAAS